MFDLAAPSHVPINLDVVRRIKKSHVCDFAAKQLSVGLWISRISDQKTMVTEEENIADASDDLCVERGDVVGGVRLRFGEVEQYGIDLLRLKARDV